MSLIAPADQQRLREAFSGMGRSVRLLFFTQTLDCDTCVEARRILDELPPLSDKITIDEKNVVLDAESARMYGIDRAPSIAIIGYDDAGEEHDSRIRFVGAPSGYEFMSLVRAVMLVGGAPSSLTEENRRRIEAADKPIVMQVFTTPT